MFLGIIHSCSFCLIVFFLGMADHLLYLSNLARGAEGQGYVLFGDDNQARVLLSVAHAIPTYGKMVCRKGTKRGIQQIHVG